MFFFALFDIIIVMQERKVLLSGVKPTGRPHIGNYFGAMKQFVDLQNTYESYIMIADYHDLGSQSAEELRTHILEVAIDHLAIGLDPKKVVFFRQSDVPEHTELAWIFNGVVTVPYLQRAHAYKDAVAKGKEPIMTLFSYPVLMAGDILMYDADVVPVGQDQKQHVEYARDIAQKFNARYGTTFKIPEPLILKDVAIVPGTDGQKMSKSYGNTIQLFASDEEIERAVMGIVTDSKAPEEPKDPESDNIFKLHKLFADGDRLEKIREGYEKSGLSYAESKEMLIEEIRSFVGPLRERRAEIAKDKNAVLQIIQNGALRAREKAMLTMKKVREKIGLTL